MASIRELCKLVDRINEIKTKYDNLFICYECGLLRLEDPKSLKINEYGQRGLFCYNCMHFCSYCRENYASSMEYEHDNCHEEHESSEEEEESEEESEE